MVVAFYCSDKTPSRLGGKGVFHLAAYRSSLKEVRLGTEGRNRGHGGGLLAGFAPQVLLSLISYSTHDQLVMAFLTVSCVIQYIEKALQTYLKANLN